MLDYAANVLDYAPVEHIRTKFEARCAKQGDEPESELLGFLGPEADVEAFWHR